MIEKYPPADPIEPTGQQSPEDTLSDEDFDAIAANDETGTPDLIRDIIWTYDNLDNPQQKPGDIPSPGAWSLLKWARKYSNRFFEQMLPKALNVKEKSDTDDEDFRHEKKAVADIRAMLQGVLDDTAKPSHAKLAGSK
jgi:hypothetical protein